MAVALALLAPVLAYILYFRLSTWVGPTQASPITFLVPAFASLWGGLVLGERVTVPMHTWPNRGCLRQPLRGLLETKTERPNSRIQRTKPV